MNKFCLTQTQAENLLVIWEKIAAESEIPRVIEVVVNNAQEITRSERALVALIEGQKLAFVAGAGEDPEKVQRLRMNLGVGIPGKVAVDGVPRRIQDGQYRSPVSGVSTFARTDLPTKAMLCVPMLFQGQTIGVIQVINKVGGTAFTPEDEYALQILANQCAVGIERMRLHESAIKESQRIHGIFEALTDGIMVVDPAGNPLLYNKAVEEMFFPGGSQNYALTTYLSSIIQGASETGSSEVVLFKPHNLILSNRYVLLKDRRGNPSEFVISVRNIADQRAIDRRFSQFYAIMLHRSNGIVSKAVGTKDSRLRRRLLKRQKEILGNLLFLTELKSGPLRIEKENCDLISLYQKARKRCDKRLGRRKIAVHDASVIGFGPQAGRYDSKRIYQVFNLLLNKGWQVLPAGSEMRVEVAAEAGKVGFELTYVGSGAEEAINKDSLDWNLQVDRIIAGEVKSLNLDLPFIGHIVHAHRGTISVATDSPGTSRVSLKLPLEL